ncbi:MAG: ROK family protein [Gammaproteobacteria bacterium]
MKSKRHKPPYTLCIDIGGTGIKMMVTDALGQPITQALRELTPNPATVKAVCQVIVAMIQSLNTKFNRVAAGFPGVVQNGIIKTAPNLHSSWIGINFEKKLTRITGYPARVANDAAVQGYGDVKGKGVELVITLGTGVGSALFLDGKLVPNVQLAHIPFRHKHTYEHLLGKAALEKHGIKKWNANLQKAIALWDQTFNYDKLFLGGGYSPKIKFKLPPRVKVSKNIEGLLGGIKLWQSN